MKKIQTISLQYDIYMIVYREKHNYNIYVFMTLDELFRSEGLKLDICDSFIDMKNI